MDVASVVDLYFI